MKNPFTGCLVWIGATMGFQFIVVMLDETGNESLAQLVFVGGFVFMVYIMYKRMVINQKYRDELHPERKGAKRRNEYRASE